MKSAIAIFLAGSLFSGSLFQFDLGLPSFSAKQALHQKAKIKKARTQIRKQRARLSKRAIKKAGKKAAGSLVPFVGSVITLGLAIEDYCDDLERMVALQNILEDTQEPFDLETCFAEAKASFTDSN